MARAKQTARADARRRTRQATRAAELAEPENPDVEDAEIGDDATEDDRGARRAVSSGPGGARPIQRRSLFGTLFSSFSTAYRRPDIRADLRALPMLLLSRGFLAAVVLMFLGALGEVVFPGYSGSNFAFQFLTYPPALAPIFVAGFFAPRASYLLGLAAGVVDVFVLLFWVVASGPALGVAGDPTAIVGDLGVALLSNAATGIVFGSAAAWYRRFLQSTSPRRQAGAKAQSNRNQGSRRAAAATSGRRRY